MTCPTPISIRLGSWSCPAWTTCKTARLKGMSSADEFRIMDFIPRNRAAAEILSRKMYFFADILQESPRFRRSLDKYLLGASMNNPDSIPTRLSLVARLKDCEDQESWREFFETYWRLIQTTARKAGLTECEAEEVVQEVVIAAAKKMPQFTYEPGKDSLKGWLLAVTRWKVADQFRKRGSEIRDSGPLLSSPNSRRTCDGDSSVRTAAIERVPDPYNVEAIWDWEWRENLLQVALDRAKSHVNPAHYEIYHLNVVRGLSARETARALGLSVPAVHLAKFRIGKL